MLEKIFKKNISTNNEKPKQKFSGSIVPEEERQISVLLKSGEILEGFTYSNGMIFDFGIISRKFIFSDEYVKEWYYTEML